jgi:hypothetical protein
VLRELYVMRPECATHPRPSTVAQAVTERHPRWYGGAIVRRRHKGFCVVPRRARGVLHRMPRTLAIGVATSAMLAAGCGAGTRQDAHELTGTFALKIVAASFPASQSIARQSKFELQVRNAGTRRVPNVAVTLDSFDYTSHYPELAADKRPVWVIERGPGATAQPPVESQEISLPGGGQTAYVNTWALGPLAPGRTQTFIWRVVPVKSGTYTVHYTVAAGLAGKARARTELRSGALVQGQLTADIAPAPALNHVNPSTGRLEPGEFPASP